MDSKLKHVVSKKDLPDGCTFTRFALQCAVCKAVSPHASSTCLSCSKDFTPSQKEINLYDSGSLEIRLVELCNDCLEKWDFEKDCLKS